jgi:DNA-binding HxlR family transcriptional regulator
LLIVRDLLRGRTRFRQLRRSVEGVTTTMLSDRLKRLEAEGVVERQFYSEYPPRAEYVLTAKGHALGMVVGALSAWGEQFTEHDLVLVDQECGHGVEVVPLCHLRPRSAAQSHPHRGRLSSRVHRCVTPLTPALSGVSVRHARTSW